MLDETRRNKKGDRCDTLTALSVSKTEADTIDEVCFSFKTKGLFPEYFYSAGNRETIPVYFKACGFNSKQYDFTSFVCFIILRSDSNLICSIIYYDQDYMRQTKCSALLGESFVIKICNALHMNHV